MSRTTLGMKKVKVPGDEGGGEGEEKGRKEQKDGGKEMGERMM